ncbi:MAG: hypothetical protein AMJ43_09685 [Coxiella sp. DG_40]|nr:MAG: hypothetical protein AMJ43_09685 [Coxiella sp. DG_40]
MARLRSETGCRAVVVFVVFVSMVVTPLSCRRGKPVGEGDISQLLDSLQEGNRLVVCHSYAHNMEWVTEEIVITDRRQIKRLYDVLRKPRYKRVHYPEAVAVDTQNALGICVFENERLLAGFLVIGDVVEMYFDLPYCGCKEAVEELRLEIHQYEASDENFLDSMREALGIRY